MPRERTITDNIVRYLRTIPHSAVRKTHGSIFTRAGDPDIVFYQGVADPLTGDVRLWRVLALEVKQPGGKLTKIQAHRSAELRKAGVKVYVVYSLEETKALVDRKEV